MFEIIDSSLFIDLLFFTHNAANHRSQKAERSGAFWRPRELALCTPSMGMNLWGESPL